MRRVLILTVIAVFAIGFAVAGNGNNLPPGPRYMLNVIAYDNCPAGDFVGSNRHMITVKASFNDGMTAGENIRPVGFSRENDILLAEGPEFRVLDGNACDDAGGAKFQLPANPYECTLDDGTIATDECVNEDLTFQAYEVYFRLVGKPGTGVDVRTCGEAGLDDNGDVVVICSSEQILEVRNTGKGKLQFRDKTKELTTVVADLDGDGKMERYPLFDDALEGYFWNWNTSGKAHAQLVFIPIPD